MAFSADWLIPAVDASAEWVLLRKASRSLPATWLNDHLLIGTSDVAMFVDAMDQTGSSRELKEYNRRNARNGLSKPTPTAMRVAFFER